MSDEFVDNLKKPSAWLRVLFMAGFVVALYVTGVVLLVIMLAQIIFSLLTGGDNQNLRRLGAGLSGYVSEILAYLTYNSELRPFPFSSFPQTSDPENDPEPKPGPEADSEPASDARPEPESKSEPTSEPDPRPRSDPSPKAESQPESKADKAESKPVARKKPAATKKTAAAKKAASSKKSTAAPKPAARKPRTTGKSAKTEGDGDS
ncbi:DUF4389 domain-containing protein [Pseudohongiella spirulinae]|uniref:Glucose-1-phosphate thymidylyltransferase n=1 Tax=Pseudohongiella spirulinae TaxID=1249552 RepID=A0A0S2KDY3_9GAMM|nr:DUF4389 domain-containing protein [Pseudohongiella spirulinae]ALO46509.1 glucose-1-phosphate thymidylyltransferase [Pseudohongiella spirulinae]